MAANAQATVTLSLIDRLTGPIKRISSRLSNLGKKLGLERITGATARLGTSLKGLGAGLASTTSRLASFTALVGLGSAGAIAGLFGLATGTAELAKEIDRLSQVAGTPSIEFQKWAYAAKTVGIEQDKMADILKDVGDKVGDFMQTGGGPMKDFFENIAPKVGVTKKAFQGLSSAQALQLYVSSLENANLSQAEMTFYMEAIANDATLLLPLLRKNGQEYNRLASEAGKAGALMSQDALNLGKAFTENLDALTRRFDALRTLVAVQLLPVFNEFVVELRELYDANVDIIRAKLIDWARVLRKVLRDLMNPASDLRVAISEWTKGFADFIARVKPVVDFVGGPLYAALGLIAAFIFGPMIAALVALTAAVFNFGAVLLGTPLGWILAGLALMGASVYVLYQKWDEFISYFSGAWGRVKDAFKVGFIDGINAYLEEFNPVILVAKGMNAVFEYFTGIDLISEGADLINSLWEGFKSTDFAQAIVGTLNDAWAAYENWWNSFSKRVRGAGSAIVQAIWDGLKDKWSAVVDWLKSSINDLIGWLPQSVQDKLGFKVNTVTPAPGNDNKPSPSSGAAAVGARVGEMGGQMLKAVPTGASEAAANTGQAPASGGSASPDKVTTQTVQTQNLAIAEPIVAHVPQSIDASINGVTINVSGGSGSPGEVAAAVRAELSALSRRNAAAVNSSLSD
ncbi:hypothetical protein [Agrobacterium larrymoorei]|uniref:hypothetical protein n=1 Tax=Agrobacterium larrymoorei TaxID=160699 RepID=UPI0030C34256